jgi:hypothetical protein
MRMQLALEAGDRAGMETGVAEIERGLAALTAEWGADHPKVVPARANLAEAYALVGRCAEAVGIARTIDSEQSRATIASCEGR